MALSKSTKTTIDLLVPTGLAGAAAWFLFTKTKKIEYVLAGAVIAFVLGYVVTSQLTKAAFTNGPAPVPTGGGCDDYSPVSLVDSIYEDTTCTLCFRKRELYDTLLGLADCQLIKCYNYWNEKYYTDSGKSLTQQISSQSSFFDSNFGQQQSAIALKFSTLNLQ